MGIGVISLLSSVIAAPLGISLEIAVMGCGILGAITKKHDEIRVLAESKLNSLSDLISTALTDRDISDKEFSIIFKELEKFC